MAFFKGSATAHACFALALGSSRTALTARSPRALPFLPYLVLLRVGFAMPRALLPGRCALTAPFHPYLRLQLEGSARLAPACPRVRFEQNGSHRPLTRPVAVYSLWHFPSNGLKAILPDVIRHTALWSSDFPLSWPCSPGRNPASTTRTATIRSNVNSHIIR